MKVLFVASGNQGKASFVVKAQGDALVKAGVDVDYFLVKGKGFKGYLKQVAPLRKYLKAHHYDVVHAHYSLSAYVATLAGAKPLVVSLMGSDVKAAGWHSQIVRLFSKFFRWNNVIVKSKDMAEAAKIKHAQIIPNGVDMDLFVPMDQKECRQKLGWKDGVTHVLFPANPDRQEKDFGLAEQVVKIAGKDIAIHVFRNVTHSDTVLYFNAADAVLLTSKWEGSPNVIKEALACCRPIVSTNVGDVKERLTGIAGCYVAETREPDELAGLLKRALDSDGQTMGRDAIFSAGLDNGQILKKIIHIYKSVSLGTGFFVPNEKMETKKGAIVLEGHVQGLSNTRALGELGIPVYVLDVVHCLAQHSKYCTKYFRCPDFKSEAFIEFLIELAQKENLREWFLIASNDHIVENLSLHQAQLTPYYKMLVPNQSNLYNIINKKKLLEIADSCGTTIPTTCYPESIEGAKSFRYPLLIKGNMGLSFFKATHQKAIQVDSYQELTEVYGNLKNAVDTSDVMIQELIPNDKDNKVVSFTCFAINGEIKSYWMGRKLREHPIKYGTATFAESILIMDILKEATPLVKSLDYTGTCEIEFLLDTRDNKYKLIEINPRTWLWVGLAKACGIDYAKMMYRYVNNISQDYPTTYQVGIKWINWLTDTVYGLKAIFKGLITVPEYIKSLKGKKVRAIWSWKDLMPGIIFPFMSFYIAKKRGAKSLYKQTKQS